MLRVPFVWVDVFAEEVFSGNPLAVLDGSGLPEAALLALTRELSLSETVFYYPPSSDAADIRVRIFTQAKEVPFAGHPVLGSACALLSAGRLPWKAPETTVRLELGIGVVPVTVRGSERPEIARFSHRRIAVPGSPISDDRLFWLPPAFGLPQDRFMARVSTSSGSKERVLYPQVVSGGALQLVVPVQSAEDVEQVEARYRDVVVAERALGSELGILVFAFTEPPSAHSLKVRARFFASDTPDEDPATGSAAAALAVYLHHHGLLAAGQFVEIDQGLPVGRVVGAPGRRSKLRATCDGTAVEVEGRVRPVLSGDVNLNL